MQTDVLNGTDMSFGGVMMQRIREERLRKRNFKEQGHKFSLMGNILDIKSKRKPKENR